MSTRHLTALTTIGLGMVWLLSASPLAGGQAGKPMSGADMSMSAMKNNSMMTKTEKIANATSAAPSTVSAQAAVLDWPAKEGAAPEVLRSGRNGWSCFPDMPDTKGNDPMCVDQTWVGWIEAYVARKAPVVTRVGIGYMMAPGGSWGSNTDPFATKEMADNHWGHHNPHLMIVVPDAKSLAGISTDPNNGGPYVMYAGTPYVHLMVPTTAK